MSCSFNDLNPMLVFIPIPNTVPRWFDFCFILMCLLNDFSPVMPLIPGPNTLGMTCHKRPNSRAGFPPNISEKRVLAAVRRPLGVFNELAQTLSETRANIQLVCVLIWPRTDEITSLLRELEVTYFCRGGVHFYLRLGGLLGTYIDELLRDPCPDILPPFGSLFGQMRR